MSGITPEAANVLAGPLAQLLLASWRARRPTAGGRFRKALRLGRPVASRAKDRRVRWPTAKQQQQQTD